MAIEDYIFPLQSLTTKAADSGALGLGPMGMGEYGVNGALMGLLGSQFMGNQEQEQQPVQDFMPENYLASGQAQAQGQMQQMGSDPFALLSQNIARRFGGA